ncbi:inactive cell surface hyaluronidase CEMIP2-like [Liolophura sinensis]|uniref:inactive cell surface hyaluronidase CEMIP2-like n=1 Tax=Liolophura sinensis TaxID=3198878 RepID=UPI0031597971
MIFAFLTLGELVFNDGPSPIVLTVEFIDLRDGGALHIGSEGCYYEGEATIVFRGKSFDKDYDIECGKKGLCVQDGGILEIHGKEKLSWTFLNKHLWAGEDVNVLTLEDNVSSWEEGDKVVISSTSRDMHDAEEFTVLSCEDCMYNQLKIGGLVKNDHYGGFYKGVDMRAEIGILTRNVKLRGEMESQCYGRNWCNYFSHDTFGGHLMILMGSKSARLEGIEVVNMGQQAFLARYPIHFHVLGDVGDPDLYNHRVYAKSLSIHHCFSRCVTVHGTNSLEVKDVVGYDTLGHCFFLEDGNEQNNTFTHNLGLVTRPGTLLPTDRDANMCRGILGAVWPGYMPDPEECTAVSTFWISHPNNNFIENAAGGSEEAGFWFIFHERPTGYGPGSLIPFAALRSPMGTFYKNRAHSSNYGLYIDDGVKITESSELEPQEYLARQPAEYSPHKDRDTSKPRVPARIEKFTTFKNNQGIQARGGDLLVTDSCSPSFPYDTGSHQRVEKSTIVGHSNNDVSGDKDADGVQFFQGPITITNCSFYDFYTSDAAITFMEGVDAEGHMSVLSSVSNLRFGHETRRFSIGREPTNDGERTRILLDEDGSLSGYSEAYIMNKNNWISRHAGCIQSKDCGCAVCSGNYGSLFVRADVGKYQQMKVWRNEVPGSPLELDGIPVGKEADMRTEFHPNVIRNKGYMMSWGWSLPHDITFYPVVFDEDDFLTVGICIKALHDFNVFWELENDKGEIIETLRYFEGASMQEIYDQDDQYYHDAETGILFFNVKAKYPRHEHYAYCSHRGCERMHFMYHGPTPTQDCIWKAYPKYEVKEVVGETVPGLLMPFDSADHAHTQSRAQNHQSNRRKAGSKSPYVFPG